MFFNIGIGLVDCFSIFQKPQALALSLNGTRYAVFGST